MPQQMPQQGKPGGNMPNQSPQPPKDTSIFGGRPWLQVGEAAKNLGKMPAYVPGHGNMTKQEIGEMAKRLNQYGGGYLKKDDFYKIKSDYEQKISKTQGSEKYKLMKEFEFLKKGFGQ